MFLSDPRQRLGVLRKARPAEARARVQEPRAYPWVKPHAAGNVVHVDTYPDFRINSNRVADAVTDRTKLTVCNSPANPTGAVWSEDEMKDIIDLVRRHDLILISDEIYAAYTYDGPEVTAAGRYENLLLLNGFSKSHAMTGWRLGFGVMPEDLAEKVEAFSAYRQEIEQYMAQFRKRGGEIDKALEDMTNKLETDVRSLAEKLRKMLEDGSQ